MNTTNNAVRWVAFLSFLLACLLAMALLVPQWSRGLNLSDEGLVWDGAAQSRRGTLDFDFFGHYSTRYALEDAILSLRNKALDLRLFWTAQRVLTALMLAGLLLRRAGPLPMLLACLAFCAGPGPIHKSLVAFFEILALLLLLWRPEKLPWRKGLALGFVLAAATGMHPYTGGGLAVACVLFFAWSARERRLLPVFLLVYFLLLPVLAPWLLKVDWHLFFLRHWELISSDYLGIRDLAVSLFTGFRVAGARGIAEAALLDFFCLAALSAVLLLASKSSLSRDKKASLMAFLLIALAGVPKILARADGAHFLQNAAPFYALCAVVFGAALARDRGKSAPLYVYTSGLGVFLMVFCLTVHLASPDYYVGGVGQLRFPGRAINIPGAALVERKEMAREVENLVETIRSMSSEDDAILSLPFAPGLYRLTGRRNPLPNALFARPEDQLGYRHETAVDMLRQDFPRVVILEDFRADGKDANRLSRVAPSLHRWIMENYTPVWKVGAFTVLQPR